MFNNKKISFLIVMNLIVLVMHGQLSKTHYIPPISSGLPNADPQDQYIYISTPNNNDVNFTINQLGVSVINDLVVSNSNPYRHTISTSGYSSFVQDPETTSQVTSNKGFIIEADDVIYVSVRLNAGSGQQAGALVSKGENALGQTFRVGTYDSQAPNLPSPIGNYLNFFSLLATEDNTTVNLNNNTTSGLVIQNYSGQFPINNIQLNKGQSYTVAVRPDQADNNRNGLIGTLISSDKPIVVNSGSANGSFGSGSGRDFGIDQIADISKIGNEYIFVKGAGENSFENVLIVAHENNTEVYASGLLQNTIQAGEYHIIEGDFFQNDNLYVNTSKDVFAYQGIGGSQSEANQGLFFVPPLSCENRGGVDLIPNIGEIGNTNFTGGITIVTNKDAVVFINDLDITNQPPGITVQGPNLVTGNSDYETYKVTGFSDDVSVASTNELYLAYFNFNGAAASGSFYSGFPSAPEINFTLDFETLGNCIPNIILSAANSDNFDEFDWFFDDGTSGFVSLNINSPNFTPTIPGTYKLIGIVTCSGLTLESDEIPISICPDDSDNDGIIDNVDIDNDNDGILNCEESLGNIVVNISNTNQPQLIFEDSSTNSSIVSSNLSQNASSLFTGDALGQINSTIDPTTIGETNYTLSFSETVNIKLSEKTDYVHTIVDGEFFTVKIAPIDKNITLQDLDDRLLIDTNFDGIFESGVTSISGSEIRFTINPSPLGSTPYTFVGSNVSGVTIRHNLDNVTDTSNYQAQVSLTCFTRDTDSDGIEDAYDLDSDNDGIPDIIESLGNNYLIPLGTDTDSDGLDDVFDISAIPIDTDMDGISDYKDLDSDNDGIFDLIETEVLGLLSDTNLDGIEDGPDYGLNGWADTAETAPESGILGYVLGDFDSDNNFNYLDLDSDGDACTDVIEAGFSDDDSDGLLGNSPVSINDFGVVLSSSDGYTIPNTDYLTTAVINIETQPADTMVCELSTTSIVVVSNEAEFYQWEYSDDGLNWTSLIDDSQYSGSNTNELTITASPISFNGWQFRVKLDKTGNSCGLYSDEITLIVTQLPIANMAPTMRLCDDDNDGTMPFNLTSQTNTINTTSGMTVTYHRTFSDAELNELPINSPFDSGNSIIYARVENDLNDQCYDISSFNIEVYDSPFPLENTSNLTTCDNTLIGSDVDGLVNIDLTIKANEILNGQSNLDFSLRYFSDASYLSEIINPETFTNTTRIQTIYVRVTNKLFPDCFKDVSFQIEVFELPEVFNPSIYSQCDDASNDGQASFNLTLASIKQEIYPNYISDNIEFTYFETLAEAQSNSAAITNSDNYTNDLGFSNETIWIRVQNLNGCFRVVPLILEVNPSSVALDLYNPTPLFECDDGFDLRDGIATFNLTDIYNVIKNNIFPTVPVSVDFYESLSDAALENNQIIDIATHQNTASPDIQSLWVRVKSTLGNSCLGLKALNDLLVVETLPVANPVIIDRQCDSDTNDNVTAYPFDTSQIDDIILGSQSLTEVSITYKYQDITGMLISSNNLPNPFFTESQIIEVIVTNNSTQDPDGACEDETSIEFIVDDQPIIADVVLPQSICDGENGDPNDDGIFPFGTATFKNTILGTQTNMDIYFDYIDETGNLIENSSTLPDPLISQNQTINVQVVNPINPTCMASTTIDLVVNPLPDFSIEPNELVCSSDPTFTVVLDPVEADVFAIYEYQWRYEDGAIVSSNNTLEVSTPGTYSVTLTTTTGSNCSTTKSVFVDASEIATITLDDIVIKDLSDNNTIEINASNNNLGFGDYEFSLDNEFGPFQGDTTFSNVSAGIHTIFVRDKRGCGTTSVEVSVIGYPKFFTPNNDGYNDYWQIKGLRSDFQPESIIYIFDRQGKLIKQLDPLNNGWDGTYNGQALITNDYWFSLFLQDGRVVKGHFTLKR